MVFNKTVSFQRLRDVKNKFGERIKDWVDVLTKKACIYPVSGKELFVEGTINTEITHKIYVSYTNSIRPDMRIKYGSRIFKIQSIINLQERNRILQLMCKELVE